MTVPAWHILDLILVELSAMSQEHPKAADGINRVRDWAKIIGDRAANFEAADIKWQARVKAERLFPDRHK